MAEDPELEDLLGSVEQTSNVQANKEDAELSQLLDSALKDFAAPTPGSSSQGGNVAEASAADATIPSARHDPSTASEADFPHIEELLKGLLRDAVFSRFTVCFDRACPSVGRSVRVMFVKTV